MRLHLIGLPQTQTTSSYPTCAYTQKAIKFCRAMARLGHEVTLYWGEQNEADCVEFVPLIRESERKAWFGEGFDTVRTPFSWDATAPYWRALNERAIDRLRDRVEDHDLILLSTGTQWPIRDAYPHRGDDHDRAYQICCEYGVGYEGIATDFCAFESSSFMHTVYALRGIQDGRAFDQVIPNLFDADDFPIVNSGGGDYLLYMGRVMVRKGLVEANEIAKATGMRLVVAGPGGTQRKAVLRGDHVELKGTHIEYVGEVGIAERAELLAGAHALLAPTLYLEPFGGIAVEAMMAGTPAITTDWGAFRETVDHGVTGWRFRTLQQAVDGVTWAAGADHELIRERAIQGYGLDAVGAMYEQWFDQLDLLWRSGWPELREPAAPTPRKRQRSRPKTSVARRSQSTPADSVMAAHFILTRGPLRWQYQRAIETAAVHGLPRTLWYVEGHAAPPENLEGVEVRPVSLPTRYLEHEAAHVWDMLAYKILHDHGGIAIGLDTISVRPAPLHLLEHAEVAFGMDVPGPLPYLHPDKHVWVDHPYNNNGVMARKGSELAALMAERAERTMTDGPPAWGSSGPILLTGVAGEFADRVTIVPFPVLSGWEGSYIWRFYQGIEQPGETVSIIHLYSSAYPQEFESFQPEQLTAAAMSG